MRKWIIMKRNLFIIDAYNLIYRMFYAIPEIHTREGIQVNAIFGVAKFLKSLAEENPDAFIIVATDTGKTFRSEIFEEYKWTRDRMPDNLRSQIDGVFELFSTAWIQILGKEGYEADDIIGTLSQKISGSEKQVVIISSDKDLCQFVDDGSVHIYDAMKRKFMRRSDVIEKFWVPPEQVRDYLAIVGDSSDNIPWLPGFGPKKAMDMLTKYGSLESIYENLADFTPKMKESLESGKELAFLSQKLANIIVDLDVDFSEDNENLLQKINKTQYIETLGKYEFKSLIPKNFQKETEKVNIHIEQIQDNEIAQKIFQKIIVSNNTIGIDADNQENIFISENGKVYSFNPKNVDCFDFIGHIFAWDVRFVCYDSKALFEQLQNIRQSKSNNAFEQSVF